MTEAESLQARRYHLLEQLSRAADEIKRIRRLKLESARSTRHRDEYRACV